jgi:hypothetical protein
LRRNVQQERTTDRRLLDLLFDDVRDRIQCVPGGSRALSGAQRLSVGRPEGLHEVRSKPERSSVPFPLTK